MKRLYDGHPATVDYLVNALKAKATGDPDYEWIRGDHELIAAYDQLPESIKTPITNKALSR